MDNDKISKALGLVPMETTNEITIIDQEAIPTSIQNDVEMARVNIHDLINTGQEAISELAQLASQSQNARTYEVFAKLVETMADTNMKLLELHERKKALTSVTDNNGPTTVHNNLFITSQELLQRTKPKNIS